MTRLAQAAWLSLLVLASCTTGSGQPPAPPASVAAGGTCGVAPNGGPLLAERGIGGTGISTEPAAGEAAGSSQTADRGIGGTGIIGVITGFASVCVNGLEVTYDATTPVQVDDAPASVADLRAGDMVVIEAGGDGSLLGARSIAVRHEVSGPVEVVEENATRLKVAGQPVMISGPVWGDTAVSPGDWVAVSGLRDDSGTIIATRIDARAPGPVIVHGRVEAQGETWRVGEMSLQQAGGGRLVPGSQVVAVGPYRQGILHATTIVSDGLAADPAAPFGQRVGRLVIESFASVSGDRVRLGPAATVGAAGLASRGSGRAVIELERRGGMFVATGLRTPATPPGLLRNDGRAADPPGARARGRSSPGSAWEPAPVSSQGRGFEGPAFAPARANRSPSRDGRSPTDCSQAGACASGGTAGMPPGGMGDLPGGRQRN